MFAKCVEKQIVVQGMSCEGCARRVQNALLALPGVKRVDVTLDGGRVNILSKQPLDDGAISQAVQNLGYKVI